MNGVQYILPRALTVCEQSTEEHRRESNYLSADSKGAFEEVALEPDDVAV